jgi:hypothetical protein
LPATGSPAACASPMAIEMSKVVVITSQFFISDLLL